MFYGGRITLAHREAYGYAGYLPISLQEEGLVCQRLADGTAATNVPWWVKHHSPTGMEWGYAGSGPADLALNLAIELLRARGWQEAETVQCWDGQPVWRAAYVLHQDLKWQIVAPLPQVGGTVSWATLTAWLDAALLRYAQGPREE